jgi:hydroxyacylglutathione hydrolase
VDGVLSGGFGAWRKAGLPIERGSTLTPEELFANAERFQTLDVRERSEFEEGHIPDARHAYVGELEERLPQLGLRGDLPVAVTCSVGHRSSLAASILLRHGFQSVSNLLGGMTAWKRLELPMREGPPHPSEAAPSEWAEQEESPPSPS